jgi:hypothetical protein
MGFARAQPILRSYYVKADDSSRLRDRGAIRGGDTIGIIKT